MPDKAIEASKSAKFLINSYYNFLRCLRLNANDYKIDYYIMKDVAVHYWRDVERLHAFHKMPRINSSKIAGYYGYWICKLRPISVINTGVYSDCRTVSKFMNEAFALHVGCGRINASLKLTNRENIKIDGDILDTLLYSMKYRVMSGDALSLFFDTAQK